MSVSIWLDESADHASLEVDVAIVGAGVTGASAAFALRDAGAAVAVIERDRPAGGASGRNAGFLTTGSVAHFGRVADRHGEAVAATLRRWSRSSIAWLERTAAEHAIDCQLRRTGSWSLTRDPDAVPGLRALSRAIAGHARDLRDEGDDRDEGERGLDEIAGPDIEERLGGRGFAAGFYEPGDAVVHPAAVVRGLLDRSGARVVTGAEVRRIERVGDRLRLATGRLPVLARQVVLAVNGYGLALHPWLRGKILPTRGQIVVTSPVARFLPAPCYAMEDWVYWRQLDDGRVLCGGLRHLAADTERGTGDDLEPVIGDALARFLWSNFTHLAGAAIDYHWAGTMAYTADGLPVVGPVGGEPGLVFAGGYSGHGMALGLLAGRLAAGAVRGEEVPALVSTERFDAPA